MTKEEFTQAFNEGFSAALNYVEDNPNTWRRFRGYGVEQPAIIVAPKAPPYVPNHTAQPFEMPEMRIKPLPLSSHGRTGNGVTDAQLITVGVVITIITLSIFYIFTTHI